MLTTPEPDGDGDGLAEPDTTYAYDAAGRLTGTVNPNGTTRRTDMTLQAGSRDLPTANPTPR